MKKFAIKILICAALLLALFGSCLFTSCSSMKKTKSKTEITEVAKTSVDSVTEEQTEIVIDIKEKVNEVTDSYTITEEIVLAPGDSLEVTTFDAAGKKTGSKKYKGSGKSTTTKEKKKTESTASTETKKKTDTNSKTELSKRSDHKKQLQQAELNKEKQGFSFWNYLFLIPWFLLLLLLLYLNKRFKLFGWIANHVRKLFTSKDTLA